jgi:hypothetical protein
VLTKGAPGRAATRVLRDLPQILVIMAILVLLVVTFSFGGSSRNDVAALDLLRPVSVLSLGVGLIFIERRHLGGYRAVAAIIVMAALLPAMQLVPLPPQLWQGLPGRQLVAEIDAAADLGALWRPLSLAPPETLNALGFMVLPLAVMLLAMQLSPRWRMALVALPIAFGLVGALLGVAQMLGDGRDDLYPFDVTNKGLSVGLFANRNHHAVALACLVPLGAAALHLVWPESWRKEARLVAGLLGMGFLVLLVLLTGSRAGLIAALVALASIILMAPRPDVFATTSRTLSDGAAITTGLVVIAGLIAAAVWQGRDLALDRLLGSTPGEGLRAQLLPTLWQMAADHWLWGTGLGTFERVYLIYEPPELLMSAYVNHAHNDWLETIITGGILAQLLVISGVIIIANRAKRLFNDRNNDAAYPLRVASLFCIILLSLASVSDYPLRTPYLAGLFTLCLIWLFMPSCEGGSRDRDKFK